MLRTLTLLATLLVAGLAAPVTAEEVRIGPCEVDACVYACVNVREPCRGSHDVCFLFAHRFWCL